MIKAKRTTQEELLELMGKHHLTLSETGRLLGVSESCVQSWRRAGAGNCPPKNLIELLRLKTETITEWWESVGSALHPFHHEDYEEFAERIVFQLATDLGLN
jgi:hypothetical protein